jgi:hypothetical protein
MGWRTKKYKHRDWAGNTDRVIDRHKGRNYLQARKNKQRRLQEDTRNWDNNLKSFPPCYSQSQSPVLYNRFPPPPLPQAKVCWNLVCTCTHFLRKPQVWELLRLCPETSTKLYVHDSFTVQVQFIIHRQRKRKKGRFGRDTEKNIEVKNKTQEKQRDRFSYSLFSCITEMDG